MEIERLKTIKADEDRENARIVARLRGKQMLVE